MNETKVTLIADLHFGKQKNCEKFLDNQLKFYYEQLIPESTGGYLYVLGDVFENRNSLNVYTINRVIKLFEDLAENFEKIVIIPGNHDLFHTTSLDVTSLNILKHIEKVYIIDHISGAQNGNYYDWYFPWILDKENFFKVQQSFKSSDRIFGHFAINGARMNGSMLSDSDIKIDHFKKVHSCYTGHFHIKQRLGNVIYIGAPYQLDRGDRDDIKGYFTIANDEVNFIENNVSAKFKTLVFPDLLDKFLIEGNIIDVILSPDDYNNKTYLAYIDEINSANPLYNPSIKILEQEEEKQKIEIKNKTLKEMLTDYITSLELENEKEITNKIMNLLEEYE